MENIVICRFGVESEAYQAFSDLKNDPHNHSCDIRQVTLVKRELGTFKAIDEFNDGKYVDDTFTGGILGAFIGILGGPIGVLLGSGIGFLGGSAKDAKDFDNDASMIERVIDDIRDECVFLAILVDEAGPEMLDAKLSRYDHTAERYDASEIRAEVKGAEKLQKQMRKDARKALRESKKNRREAE